MTVLDSIVLARNKKINQKRFENQKLLALIMTPIPQKEITKQTIVPIYPIIRSVFD